MNYKLPIYYGASAKLFEYAKKMRHAPTEAEPLAWGLLNNNLFKGFHFRRQHPIATYIADFYLHPVKLVIEIDGGYHQQKFQKEYDDFRDQDMATFNIAVLRLTNHEIMYSSDIAVAKILETIRGCLKLLDAFCYNLRAEPPNPLKGALTAAFVLKPPLGGLGVKQEGLNKLFDRNLNNL